MAKSKTTFVCENCGHHEPKWTGRCLSCGEWNTFVEEEIAAKSSQIISTISGSDIEVVKLSDVDIKEIKRTDTGFYEFNRVLGGGLVEDEVLLISGDPGIGKSTLLLQTANNLAKNNRILYVSGEESAKQIALRADRLFEGQQKETANISFLGNGEINKILSAIRKDKPQIVIIDSIQTIFDETVSGLPGGLAQVRASSSKLIYAAKSEGFILIIVGHINKDGRIAGPKVLEHLVDCVLQFEGERGGEFRVLRGSKNRFGSTGEVGIFVMGESGLNDLTKENSLFSSNSEDKEVGVAKTLIVEGSRPLVLDIQVLSSSTVYAYPKRVAEGASLSKIQVLSAIADQIKSIKTIDRDIYVKTSGGYSIKNYSYGDLGILAALISSSKNKPLDQSLIFIGEVTLNGRVHVPQNLTQYIKEVARLFPKSTIVGPNYKHKRFIPVQNISSIEKLIG